MSLNAPLLASPHCLPPRSGQRRHTSAWHRLSCAQQQSRLRPAHRRWGEPCGERGRNHPWPDAWAYPGPDTNGLASMTLVTEMLRYHKSPASIQHTHRVAQSTTRQYCSGASSQERLAAPPGKLKQPLGPHAGGDTPEAPTSLTDIDTTHACAQWSGHLDPKKFDIGRERHCSVASTAPL